MKKSFLAGAIALSLIFQSALLVSAEEIIADDSTTGDASVVLEVPESTEDMEPADAAEVSEIFLTEDPSVTAEMAEPESLTPEDAEPAEAEPVEEEEAFSDIAVEAIENVTIDPIVAASSEDDEDEDDTKDYSSLPTLTAGAVNEIKYTANSDNRYRLEIPKRTAYAMKFTEECDLTAILSCGGRLISSSYWTVFILDAGTYAVDFLDSEGEPLATSGTAHLEISERPVVTRLEFTTDNDLLAGCPNTYDFLMNAADITVFYEDGTSEKATLGKVLDTDYDIEWTVDVDSGQEFEAGVTTGSATIYFWCVSESDKNLSKSFRITLINESEYSGHKHSFDIQVIDRPPTYKEDGIFHFECECGKADPESIRIPKLKPMFELNVSSIKLKTKQSTKKVVAGVLVAGDRIVSWKSSNTKIVKVSQSGKITAQKKAGKATVTATTESGLTASVKVQVQKKAVKTSKITGVPKSVKLAKGEKLTLKPVLSPITSSEKIKYSSSNKKVATVSSSGKVTAKKKGTAKITVKSGKKKVTCKITVK